MTNSWKHVTQWTLLAESTVKGMPSSEVWHTMHVKHSGWKALPDARSNFSVIALLHLAHFSSVFYKQIIP